MKIRKPVSKLVVYSFFVIGLVSAASFRLLIVFKYLSPHWFRPVWYMGIIGYLFFFGYRFIIAEKRRHAIQESGLLTCLKSGKPLTQLDRDNAIYILSSVMISRENWNYFAIFILSFMAIMLDIILSIKVG